MTQDPQPHALVTGGSGFLGGFVIPQLVEHGYRVSALARSDAAASTVTALGASPVVGDLDDAASLQQSFAVPGAAILVNLASLGFGHAAAIVGAAESAGLRRAVFISTTAIFTTLNAPSKIVRTEAERIVRTSDLDWTIIRPTMIYGTPDDRNMVRLLRRLRRLPLVPMPGGGRHLQQPVHVSDLADAVVSACSADVAVGKAYDVGGPEPLTFRQIVASAGGAVGRSPLTFPIPVRPLVRVLRLLERTGRSMPIKAEQIQRLVEDKAFDISDAVRDLGYRPRPFAEGIEAEARMLNG